MNKSKQDPFNLLYLFVFILVLCISTLPASLTWFEILSR